ncbi:MAG TPA: serine/threonine-protein kinase [Bryobacteraceae bacterium]|nr:serine/threonine-protein kinase [Bryobacteraceae bacterium]
MRVVRAPSSTTGDLGKKSAFSLPPKLLDKAVTRLCFISIISAVSTVALFLANGQLQPEAALAQQHPLLRLVALSMVLLSFGFFGLQRSGWFSKQNILHLGAVFQVLMSYAIGLAETTLVKNPGQPVIGVSSMALWIILCGILIPNTPMANLLAGVFSVLAWPAAYYTSLHVYGHEFIGWNRILMWMFPLTMSALWTNFLSRNMYSMQLESAKAEELGSYKLERRIGQGGMGEVWLASHRMLARNAAVKLIRPDVLSGQTMRAESVIQKRFEREARATAALRNPHTVALYDFGITRDRMFYYVMELLEGIDIQTLVDRHGPMHPGRVRNILIQICESLEEAHRLGMVHRDIKPRNIFLSKLGWQHDFAKVLDFGLVKTALREDESLMTMDGAATGTPAYMAPEVALGGTKLDGRTDIYSLGCLAYFMLTGELVFPESSPTAIALAHVQKPPVPPSQRVELPLPAGLERVILQCLEKDPQNRPRSAQDLACRLESLEDVPIFGRGQAASWWETNLPNPGAEHAELEDEPEEETRLERAQA